MNIFNTSKCFRQNVNISNEFIFWILLILHWWISWLHWQMIIPRCFIGLIKSIIKYSILNCVTNYVIFFKIQPVDTFFVFKYNHIEKVHYKMERQGNDKRLHDKWCIAWCISWRRSFLLTWNSYLVQFF